MAKIKKEDNKPAHIKELVKKYGNVIITGTQILEQKKDYKVVSIGPAIDLGLNGGIREGSWIIMSGAPKSGKAQPYSSVVYTPSGPKLMGEIWPGDEVATPSGSATVVATFPQGTVEVFKITFNDGSSTRATADHLWKVKKNCPDSEWELKTTEQLEIDLQFQDRDKWMIPVEPIEYVNGDTPLNFGLLGFLLADGTLSSKKEIKINTDNVSSRIKEIISLYECIIDNRVIKSNLWPGHSNQILDAIKELKLNVVGNKKFIPNSYKYAWTEFRIDLLKTMISCNGHYHKSGYIEYTSSSEQLIKDMAEVGRSLGIICRVVQLKGIRQHSFRVTFHGESIHLLYRDVEITKTSNRLIESIKPDGLDRCQCIKLDDEDNLYFTDDLILTHNTTTAMQLAYNCQKEGRPVIYANTEGRLSQLNFEVAGLDPEKMTIITAEDVPLSAEIFLDIIMKLITLKENEGALCIIDSTSSLIPARDLDLEVSGMTRPGLPKLLSDFTKKAGQVVPNNKIIMCLITHMITNISGYGAGKMADSGEKIKFQSDTRMEVKSIAPWEQSDKQIGQAVNWKIYWSGLGATGNECQSWIKYGHGIDKIQELLIMAQEAGLITGKGWMTCDFLLGHLDKLQKLNPDLDINNAEAVVKACKVQGMEKLYNFMVENPDLVEILEQEIKSLLL